MPLTKPCGLGDGFDGGPGDGLGDGPDGGLGDGFDDGFGGGTNDVLTIERSDPRMPFPFGGAVRSSSEASAVGERWSAMNPDRSGLETH